MVPFENDPKLKNILNFDDSIIYIQKKMKKNFKSFR